MGGRRRRDGSDLICLGIPARSDAIDVMVHSTTIPGAQLAEGFARCRSFLYALYSFDSVICTMSFLLCAASLGLAAVMFTTSSTASILYAGVNSGTSTTQRTQG